ncbi:hypothetical protein [Streptomyces sp. NPDC046988]
MPIAVPTATPVAAPARATEVGISKLVPAAVVMVCSPMPFITLRSSST